MNKILLTGSTGFFGNYFNTHLKKKNLIYNIINKSNNKNLKNKFKLNLQNQKKIDYFVKRYSPSIIVHAAAITDVDYCEKFKISALRSNYISTKNLVNVAKKYKKFFIFISSDQLFDGSKKNITKKVFIHRIIFIQPPKLKVKYILKKI